MPHFKVGFCRGKFGFSSGLVSCKAFSFVQRRISEPYSMTEKDCLTLHPSRKADEATIRGLSASSVNQFQHIPHSHLNNSIRQFNSATPKSSNQPHQPPTCRSSLSSSSPSVAGKSFSQCFIDISLISLSALAAKHHNCGCNVRGNYNVELSKAACALWGATQVNTHFGKQHFFYATSFLLRLFLLPCSQLTSSRWLLCKHNAHQGQTF